MCDLDSKRFRNGLNPVNAYHIFELSPKDWQLLLRHAGWTVVCDQILYQYAFNVPVISRLLARFWRRRDFEGFWGAILRRDLSISDCYLDWEEYTDND